MPKVLISVIISNYNSEFYIKKCLESVLAASGNFELIIVDAGSSDNSMEIIKHFLNDRRVMFFIESHCGPAKARNVGVSKSHGDILIFLDCDTVVKKDWLSQLPEYLQSHPTIGAGQLKLLRFDTKKTFDSAGDKLTKFGFLAERAREAVDVGQFETVEPIFSGKGAALFIRREVFDTIGGFDEDYYMYWEEPDLFWRVWKSGYEAVYFPHSIVWHMYNSSLKPITTERLVQITYLGCRNHIMTILKNAVGWKRYRMLIFVTISWIFLMTTFLLNGNLRRAAAVIKAFGWLLIHQSDIRKKRTTAKSEQWFSKISTDTPIQWYIGKGMAYVQNKPF